MENINLSLIDVITINSALEQMETEIAEIKAELKKLRKAAEEA